MVLPTFALVYLMGASERPWRRLGSAAIGGLILLTVSLSWVAVYDLTPPHKRPYAGTTDTNSALELAVGPYGIGRFVRQTRPSVTATAAVTPVRTETTGVVAAGNHAPSSRRPATSAGPTVDRACSAFEQSSREEEGEEGLQRDPVAVGDV